MQQKARDLMSGSILTEYGRPFSEVLYLLQAHAIDLERAGLPEEKIADLLRIKKHIPRQNDLMEILRGYAENLRLPA